MKFSNIFVVYHKELIETLRDRRTLLSAIVAPILLFPILTIGFGTIVAKLVEKARAEASTVMLLGAENAPTLAKRLSEDERLEIVPASDEDNEDSVGYVELINEKKLRAAVEFPEGFEAMLNAGDNVGDVGDEDAPAISVYHYAGEMRSRFAVSTVRRIAQEYREELVSERLESSGLSTEILTPFETNEENVATPEKVGGNVLGGLLPYMIILLCLTGALYPALDLTAGEKERGTIETILASPVARVDLVLGKFLVVLSMSLTTAVLALGSFALTLAFASSFVERLSRGGAPFSISIKAVAAVFFMVLPLAVLFSAALLAIALMAKSFKEAQSYVQPLIIIVFMPAIAAILPGVELNAKLALVPILNVSLVSKEIFTGSYPWGLIGLIFASTCVYAGAALFVAVRQFHREEVLFRA